MPQETRLLAADPHGIAEAAALLAAGHLVAFPTETVYGLGADARNDRAVAAIFAAKGRPAFNPLIVHVAGLAEAEEIAHFDATARRLAATFWPGPLTLVLRLRENSGISALVTAGTGHVALRAPAHPLARALLQASGLAIAAPSANPSGAISPTRAAHVLAGLGGKIAAVIDGGACAVGVESTILGFAPEPHLLRPGGLPLEAIEACLGAPVPARADDPERPTAPGQLASHYAPDARLRLNATAPRPDEVWIGFGPPTGEAGQSMSTGEAGQSNSPGSADLTLSPHGDLVEAAANLFHILREADALAGPGGAIAVAPIPATGLGRAINDRLARAATPRPPKA